MDLIERVTATQQTIDLFTGQPFKWGENDCAQLCHHHLIHCLIPTRMSEAGEYKTERGAKRALRKLGVTNMEELAALHEFEPIAPAAAIIGDIIGFPGGTEDHPWTALGVHCGGERILGYADPDGSGGICTYGPISVCTHAWRVVR